MTCASCGRTTKSSARFCGGCGASLAQRCPACGAETDPGSSFCEACGAALEASAPGAAGDAVARKVVTILFADLIGSTALHERLDPESVSRAMEAYHAAVRVPVEAHGGTVVQLLGDGVMCAFGVPRTGEDDALRAVRAAVDVQRSFREFLRARSELASRIGLRVAVNTGEVVVSDDYAAGIGDPLNVAGRLQQEAKDGEVLIGEATQRLVAEQVTLTRVGAFALKGRAEPVTAYRVVSLERPARAAATPFVGRDEELSRLLAVYDAALAAPAARLAVLLGSPGLGKSRLLAELARRLEGRASVIAAQCNPAGGPTFAPLAEALRAHLGLEPGSDADAVRAAIDARVPGDAAERGRIASGFAALLAGAPASPEETFFEVRRLLSALAAERPVVLAIDDVQWAEPLLLDFTEHLVQWGAGIPLLVLAAARPELRDKRSSFTTPGNLVSEVVTLGGLDAAAAMRLAANVIGADTLPAPVAGRVLTASEGNPLFVGELVRMLVNDGTLRRDGERWTLAVDLAALEMPPTIQALLAARIERLRPEERLVLERAAVVGRQFSRAAVTHLLPREAHGDLDARLEALRRSELIEADAGWLLGEPALRFHHVLIRDAAYRRVLRGTRAELHARLADWLEKRAGESLEHGETIGWHLEQAHLHLRELGPLDANGRALGERAARDLAAAGRRALARDDLQPAAGLLGRALACLGDADPARAELVLDWCEALLAAGDVATAARAITEFGRFTAGSERLRAWHACFAGELAALTDPQALHASADAVEAAARTLTEAGDAAGEAKAHFVHALALERLGRIGPCEAALDHALAAARRANDRRRSNAVLAGVPVAALWGPSPVTRASGRCLDVVRVLRITQGAPAVEAVALRCQAVLETLRGRAEAARRMIASARRMVEELGITRRVLEADLFAGLIELLEGDAVAAEPLLRTAHEGLRAQGLGIDAAQAAALLGRALLAQGRTAEAEAISHESEALAGDDFKAAIAWRGVRAEALAARGEHEAALGFAKAAVEIAAATDDLLDHADAHRALAVALHAAGRSAEASSEEQLTIALWEQKGATVLAERARRAGAHTAEAKRAALERAPETRVQAVQRPRRHVRANRVTAAWERNIAAFDARDADAASALSSSSLIWVDHANGVSYGRDAAHAGIERMLRSHARFSYEPIATLGESLGLSRWGLSGAGVQAGGFDVASYEGESILVAETGTRGLFEHIESFAADKLGDAIARLYERYAELLPDGPERIRAAAMARIVAAMQGPRDPDRWGTSVAPAIEFVDRRSLVGVGSVHGADALQRSLRSLEDLSDEYAIRFDDVFATRSDALLVRSTNFGTDRASGGAYERQYLGLFTMGEDGRLTRIELFDPERVDEALARFAELTAEAPPARAVRRRVRPNLATAGVARLDAAIAARDLHAVQALVAPDFESVNHPTATVSDGSLDLGILRALLDASDPVLESEDLATLGDFLGLHRQKRSFSALVEGDSIDVGPALSEYLTLVEANDRGQAKRVEVFDLRHLSEAFARLYERYAELLPEGPDRARAAATAHAVAGISLPPDPARWIELLAPGLEFVDRRIFGVGSVHGADALMQSARPLLDLTGEYANRIEDIVAARPDAYLVFWSNFGTVRDSGGAFEREHLMLLLFGADGRVARSELFDSERVDEALARFDELTAEPAPRRVLRRVPANAGTAHAEQLNAAIAARDFAAVRSLMADGMHAVLHPTGAALDREETLAWWRLFFEEDRDGAFRVEPVATLGDSLALCRQSWTGTASTSGVFDLGPYQRDAFALIEGDARGRIERSEVFAPERLGDAVARLYERYAELLPDSPERECARAGVDVVVGLEGPLDLERLNAKLSPSVEMVDRRTLVGIEIGRGAEGAMGNSRAFQELTDDFVIGIDDILGARADVLLARCTCSGTARVGGGAFELAYLLVVTWGPDGRLTRIEQFDVDRDAEALARFDELTAEPPPAVRPVHRRVRANAATANAARVNAAFAARDADALAGLMSDGAQGELHMTGVVLDRQAAVAGMRLLFADRDAVFRLEPVAALGDSLALCRQFWSGSASADTVFDIGAFEADALVLIEADDQARSARFESFALDHFGDAVARLYERNAELRPEGPEGARGSATARSVSTMLTGPVGPPERFPFAPDAEATDHRTVGFGSLRGSDVLQAVRSLMDLTESFVTRVDDVLGLRSDALLVRWATSGTLRVSGGAFERETLMLWVFDAHGLVARWEQFDADRDAEALARFDELSAEPPPAVLAVRRRRVRPNAATENVARVEAAVVARDEGALARLHAGAESFDRVLSVRYDREQSLRAFRMLWSAREPEYRDEVLASLGESLALSRLSVSAGGMTRGEFDVGGYETERISLREVDREGRSTRIEHFAPDRLGNAVVRLYEWYAELLPEGLERTHAAATARSVATMLTAAFDPDRWAMVFAPAIEGLDHRTLGTHSARGADALLGQLRAWLDLASDAIVRYDDVLGLRSDAVLHRTTFSGVDRAGGGAFEREFSRLLVFGADGLVTRMEWFDADRDAEALARFDELTAAPPETPFANAAWRAMQALDRASEQRDWDALVALAAPGLVIDDRRSLVRTRVEGEASFANLRFFFDAQRSTSRQLLATRGERLALDRQLRTTADRHGGLAEFEYVSVNEVDATGRRVASVVFDPDDLDAAYAELEARYAAGEAAPHPRALKALLPQAAAMAARDWAEVTRAYTPDFVLYDHRLLGRGEISRDELVAGLRAIVELAPDARLRGDHILDLDERGVLTVNTWVGSRDGGPFEIPFVTAMALSPDGRFRESHVYDLDQLDAARARFAELTAAARPSWLPNAATRAGEEVRAAWASRDWERFAATHAPDCRRIDRRRLVRLDLDRAEHLEFSRSMFKMESSRPEWEVLATRGDRLALSRYRFEGSDRDVGPSEIEFINVSEVDARGKYIARVIFDPDDLDAAYAELDERHGAMKKVPFLRAVAARDWDAVAALLAPDFVREDYRLLGRGTLHGPAAYIAHLRSLVDLAPDAKPHVDHMEYSGRGALSIAAERGTWEGGAFENPMVVVSELDAQGRVRRVDSYDLEQLAEARARFDALAASAPDDPVAALIRPNAASAAINRLQASGEARDWAAVRALAADGARFEDRRRHVLVSGDVDWWIADLQRDAAAEIGNVHYQRTPFAIAGDRVCIERVLWTAGPADGRVEVEYLWLGEVDESGRLVGGVMFDVDDWRAAQREALARLIAADTAAAVVLRPFSELLEGYNDGDRTRMRPLLADDLVHEDHGRSGVGRIDGADALLQGFIPGLGIVGSIQIASLSIPAIERHGAVGVVRIFGTLADGGDFESLRACAFTVAGGRITRLEIFEIEQLDAALALLADLRPDPLRIPPNAATRAGDLRHAAGQAGDWDALRALASPDFRFEDRGKISQVSGGVEMWIENHRFVGPTSGERELIGTAGDRVALERVLWRDESDGAPVEIEFLRLTEVDAEGRVRAVIRFDPDDRAAAFVEAQVRFAAGEAASVWGHALRAVGSAITQHDWAALRSCLADDFVVWDRRAPGVLGTLGPDAWVEAMRVQLELAPDVQVEPVRHLAWNRHGRVVVTRRFGTLRDGGPFENFLLSVMLDEGDRVKRNEVFDVADTEQALARFEELCAGLDS